MREKLTEIIHRVSPQTKEIGVTDGADLVSDLHLDSYDRVEIIIIAESEMNIEINEEIDLATVRTFGDLLAMVEMKVAANA